MSKVTVLDLSTVVGIPVDRLIQQLADAGVQNKQANDLLNDEDKIALLTFLRRAKTEENTPHKRVRLKRKRVDESGGDSSRTVSVEVKKRRNKPENEKPAINRKVFLSYAWGSDHHNNWVKKIASRLRTDGVNAILDRWELHPGDPITEFMEKSIFDSDYVLLVCTPNYKVKADGRKGGVGYEGSIISSELYSKSNHRKFIPILREGSWADSSPLYTSSKLYVDLRDNEPEVEEENYRDLLITILGRRESAPPLGVI